MPAYWVLISLAGYRAVVDLVRRPHYWEKTRHGLGGSGRVFLPPPRAPVAAAAGHPRRAVSSR
jgi:hypothetical protein